MMFDDVLKLKSLAMFEKKQFQIISSFIFSVHKAEPDPLDLFEVRPHGRGIRKHDSFGNPAIHRTGVGLMF